MSYRLPLKNFSTQLARQPHTIWLHQPVDGEYRKTTWAEADQQARRIAAGLLAQGYQAGDRIGILSKNCAEWFVADLAIMMAGLVSVPIYATAGVQTIRQILAHSGARAIFLGKLDSLAAADAAIPPDVLRIALPYRTAKTRESWKNWLQLYEPLDPVAKPQPDDIMTICYTSGSTGEPKGVVLSFNNVAAGARHSANVAKFRARDRMLSYLPLAHITERVLVEMASMQAGCSVYFVESLDEFATNLAHARPTVFISVPRLWSKFQSQILHKMPQERLGQLMRIPLIGRLVAWRIRKAMGLHRCRLFGSGTAPISPSILAWFASIRIRISEGWGMTETAGLACANIPYRREDLGTIGVPLPCVEMRLAEDGEILIRGDTVFRTYYRNEAATAETFSDGWMHTGDVATQRPNGAYRIVGRKKEQFKTGKGKYVQPVPIESLLSANPAIEQVCVMGSGRNQPIALLVMGDGTAPDEAVRASLEAQLREVNGQLESHQRLAHIVVCHGAWDIENDFLTPTLKLRRNVLEAHYQKMLDHARLERPVLWESEL